ncbi:MAG: hypothetical protein ACI9BH_000799 [Paracoccaceae bacterium]|jgi:hypothetical protein
MQGTSGARLDCMPVSRGRWWAWERQGKSGVQARDALTGADSPAQGDWRISAPIEGTGQANRVNGPNLTFYLGDAAATGRTKAIRCNWLQRPVTWAVRDNGFSALPVGVASVSLSCMAGLPVRVVRVPTWLIGLAGSLCGCVGAYGVSALGFCKFATIC